MIPLSDSIKSRSFPFVTIAFILANIYVFYLELTSPDLDTFINSYAFISSRFSFFDIVSWIRIISSIFLHGGWLHIASNMLFLWVFGDNVEDALGHINFVFFYFLSGVAATLMQYLINTSSEIPMIGASGAIAGVLGAYWTLYPHSKIHSLVPIGFFITTLDIPASLMIDLWFITQLFNGYASIADTTISGDVGGVAFWAHVGGFVAGIVLVRLFQKSDLKT